MAVLFKNVRYLTPDFQVQEGFVGVQGRDIAYLGADEPPEAAAYDMVIEGRGKLLLPGLVNTHTHLPMTLLRGYGENLSLQDWLFTRIFPFEAKLTSEAIYWATKLALAESLRFGVTSCTDMYMDVNAICRAVDETKKINPHKLKTMKSSLMRICILIGLSLGLLLGTSSYAASRRPAKSISRNSYTMIRGSEHIVTRTKEAPAFHAIHASRAVEVIIGGTDEIVIKANDNVIDYVVVEPENGTLRISIVDRVNIRNMDVTVRIPNNGKIETIKASSGAEIHTESALKASDMDICLSSAASLDIALKAERCTILLSSGTDLKAAADLGQCNIGLASGSEARFSGKAEAMVAKVSSGAELNAFGMVARMCEVDVASGAEAEVNCSEKLTARASSGGSVKYKGDCQVNRKVSSGGEIRKKR